MNSSQNKLCVKNVTKTFSHDITAIQNISVHIKEGEIVSIIGPSGCGKSTMLDLIAGLSLPDSGDILLNGQSIVGKTGKVSYMPQNDVLLPWRTIIENVTIGLEVQGMKKKEAKIEAKQLLPAFGLEQYGDHYPYMLSGGMKQRASFLRSVLCKKEVMLLDEPFGKLDALTKRGLHEWLIERWQESHFTMMLVTHDVDEAIYLSDRIYIMSHRPGKIIAEIKIRLEKDRLKRSITSVEFASQKEEILSILEGKSAAAFF